MTHEGRMIRGKYNSDNNINLNNADTLYYLDNKTSQNGLKRKLEVSEKKPKAKKEKKK